MVWKWFDLRGGICLQTVLVEFNAAVTLLLRIGGTTVVMLELIGSWRKNSRETSQLKDVDSASG